MKKEFSFMGCSVGCDEKKPHLPHIKSHYSTVCWGSLANFCVGKSGVLPDGRTLKIKIKSWGVFEKSIDSRPRVIPRSFLCLFLEKYKKYVKYLLT